MSSLALWYIPKNKGDEQNPAAVEVHFNLWKLPISSKWVRTRTFSRYLDIGLMLYNATKVQSINLYIPEKVNKNEIKDLGGPMKDDELVCAVFNANLQIQTTGSSDFYNVSSEGKQFTIYKLAKENFTITPNAYDGTIININIASNKHDNLYIRFRILGNYLDKLSYIDKPTNAVLQSAFYKTDTIDFRANEVRVLNNKLLEEMENGNRFKFTKIHFFFICSSREECFFSHVPYVNCRRLEHDKWEEYIEPIPKWWHNSLRAWYRKKRKKPEIGPPPILAYHWKPKGKEDKPFDDFNVLIKTKYEHNDYLSIAKYLLVALIIGILINLATTWLENCFKNDSKDSEDTTYIITFNTNR